ncbi:hypothetical protein COX69_01525, partial [Candidatus Falkowbacteria bacterium CG_4_10_14_0_2_um_filter_48_10]
EDEEFEYIGQPNSQEPEIDADDHAGRYYSGSNSPLNKIFFPGSAGIIKFSVSLPVLFEK